MSIKRYYNREMRVEDIEKRGGTFIQRQTLEKDCCSSVVEGTLVFGKGESAEILVKNYLFGGKRVMGPAKRTIEGLKGYNKLLDVFEELENDRDYASHATARQWIAGITNLILVAMMVIITVGILRFDIKNLVPELIRLGTMLAVWFIAYYAAIACRRL